VPEVALDDHAGEAVEGIAEIRELLAREVGSLEMPAEFFDAHHGEQECLLTRYGCRGTGKGTTPPDGQVIAAGDAAFMTLPCGTLLAVPRPRALLRSRPMDTPLAQFRPEDSMTFARSRDASIRSLLDTHPVTAAMLVGLGWFPNKKKALERLRLLTSRKQLARVGVVWRRAARPENVYCRWHPKSNQLLHEVELSEVCLRLSAGRILRGPDLTDRATLADTEVWINQQMFYLELDRGTMRRKQIEGRLAKYERCPHLLLWVCSDGKRMEELRAQAEKVRHTALFMTFAQFMANPHGEIWRDVAGDRAALPRERLAKAE
jgi:hypothetical protein